MDKPAEILLFDYLTEQVEAAAAGDVLFEIELHDTVYQSITKTRGVRISDAVGDMSPGPAGEIKEFNVDLQIVCYAKVEGKDKKQRQEALTAVFAIQQEMYRVLIGDSSMGGRVCDVKLLRGSRGYDVFDGNPYAVANLGVLINEGVGA